MKYARPRLDLVHRQFGKLHVVKFVGMHPKTGRSVWQCRCDCGNVRNVAGSNLMTGNSTSCGCLQVKHGHGATKTRVHNIWVGMKQRCLNPNNPSYKNYGGRGIKVCKRWLKFENFLADMGQPPAHKSLDRWPNKNGGYSPANCRWATIEQQSKNKRKAVALDNFTNAELLREVRKRGLHA